ncbi:MAG: ribosome maturation factor RimP [Clostridia bacterium]|nr:ribosome maturation factor RimP [Clostridia bacterium]
MAGKKNVDAIKELVERYALPLGIEVVEVRLEKLHDGLNLTVFIDKEGGVTMDDCETLHRAIDDPLDVLNPTDDMPYTLNVSSLGLDRPLKTQRDFQRNLGKEITVKLYAAQDGKKMFEGFLKSFDNESFTIETKKGEISFTISKVAHIEPLLRF